MPTTIKADLYSIGNTATVVTDGFAFQATNKACVKNVNGEIRATKFGLHRVGPGTVKSTREQADELGDEYFDRITENINLRVYYSDAYYIPTTIDRVFADHDNYALYDTENSTVYNVRFDENEGGTYNLIGTRTNTVKKIDTDNLENQIGTKFEPLVKIEP